jgi:hypothetical protein
MAKMAKHIMIPLNRERWFRGKGTDVGSMLERPYDGMQCCIGQAALYFGLTSADIRGIPTVGALPSHHVETPQALWCLCDDNADAVHAVYRANDEVDPGRSDEERIKNINDALRAAGAAFRFM